MCSYFSGVKTTDLKYFYLNYSSGLRTIQNLTPGLEEGREVGEVEDPQGSLTTQEARGNMIDTTERKPFVHPVLLKLLILDVKQNVFIFVL